MKIFARAVSRSGQGHARPSLRHVYGYDGYYRNEGAVPEHTYGPQDYDSNNEPVAPIAESIQGIMTKVIACNAAPKGSIPNHPWARHA